METPSDQDAMQVALEWAQKGMNTTTPNPRVGCVIVQQGKIIGVGHTQPAGQAHAEVQALRNASSQQIEVRGATAYVTLEPCSHFGRTPPCADALIASGIARVVVAILDPNPLVSGRGVARLRAAGITVDCPVLEQQAHEINIGFFQRMQTGKPWVRMKAAASLDGKTALLNGQSQWITSAQARADGHHWRARACAILTGIGTILEDDPQLTVRALTVTRQPLRVIVDSTLQTPVQAKALVGGALIVHAMAPDQDSVSQLRQAQLRAAGAELLYLPDPHGKVDLAALMLELGRREINELHVEAGAKLNSSLIRAGCVDELLLYVAPCLLGEARSLFSLPALTDLSKQTRCYFHEVQQIGPDLRLLVRFHPTTIK